MIIDFKIVWTPGQDDKFDIKMVINGRKEFITVKNINIAEISIGSLCNSDQIIYGININYKEQFTNHFVRLEVPNLPSLT